MFIEDSDISSLKSGEPPDNKELIENYTLGQEAWLNRIYDYYLDNYIPKGGSKVKVLIGNEGTGKTHLLRCIEYKAREMGYNSIYFSARNVENKINNIINFYRLIAASIDFEKIITGLCLKVATNMGYNQDVYDGSGKIMPLLIKDGFGQYDAAREIRNAVYNTFKDSDLSPSFFTFACIITRDRMIDENEVSTSMAKNWLMGEKLERFERRATSLFERLQRTNARYWLNSLIALLNYSGVKGFVVLIDDLEVLTKKDEEFGKFIFTPNQVKDFYELIRQIIDDAELLNQFFMVIAGDRSLIDDEKRGFKSYEALWMRLQTGLVPSGRFNSFADIVDTDEHLRILGDTFPQKVSKKLIEVLSTEGFGRNSEININNLNDISNLKAAVIEVGLRAERKVRS
ncbi:MAG: ATP-binding protein [Actinobacteria bacterium]|nr:ATP-binding protein [Actinomycetota bacterium]